MDAALAAVSTGFDQAAANRSQAERAALYRKVTGAKRAQRGTPIDYLNRSDADLEHDYGGPVRHFGSDSQGRTVTVSEYRKGKTTYPKVK